MKKGIIRLHEKRFEGGVERLRSPERWHTWKLSTSPGLFMGSITQGNLLDVGTGSGLFAESFARRGMQVAGVDVKQAMLEAAGQFVPAGDFRQGIIEALPFQDHSYDLVFLGLVLHEADDPLKALQEPFV